MGQTAKVIQVIETDELRGQGNDRSPMRRVTQYFTSDGVLLAEVDPFKAAPREGVTPDSPAPAGFFATAYEGLNTLSDMLMAEGRTADAVKVTAAMALVNERANKPCST